MVATDLTNTTPSRSKDMTEYIDETEYTDEELALAIHAATYVRSGSISINHDISQASRQIHTSLLNDLRAILKHLPAQQGDWEDVTDILQIRRGDMLKNETENALIAYKYAVKRVNLSDCIIHLDNDELVFWHDNHTYYRIPAPVTPPDPALHPVIMIPRYNGVDRDPHLTPAVWDGRNYKTVNETEYFSAKDITNWTPAKVTALED